MAACEIFLCPDNSYWRSNVDFADVILNCISACSPPHTATVIFSDSNTLCSLWCTPDCVLLYCCQKKEEISFCSNKQWGPTLVCSGGGQVIQLWILCGCLNSGITDYRNKPSEPMSKSRHYLTKAETKYKEIPQNTLGRVHIVCVGRKLERSFYFFLNNNNYIFFLLLFLTGDPNAWPQPVITNC